MTRSERELKILTSHDHDFVFETNGTSEPFFCTL